MQSCESTIRKVGMIYIAASLMLLTLAGTNLAAEPAQPLATDMIDAETAKQMLAYLEDINQWIITLDVGSGKLKGTAPKEATDFIFVNSNLARTLLASATITGNESYRTEAMRWCDTLYRQQQITISSKLNEAGFWPDQGRTGNIYFGDMGTAATALAMGYRLADTKRQKLYLNAMERMARFVLEGTIVDPQDEGRDVCDGWVIKSGPDCGALGCGYISGHLSTIRYTVATSNTGAAYLSELYGITQNDQYKQVAVGAVKWLLKIRKDSGEIPYTLDGKDYDNWPLDTMSYCGEGFISADTHLKDPELHAFLKKEIRPCVQWLLTIQNPDGSWGKLRSSDQQRSPRCLSVLTWYYRNCEQDPAIATAVQKYCKFLLKPENSKAYGVKELVKTTGFVGLAVAELLAPGSTF